MTTPNPGSAEAGKLGCTCAVLDNNHGRSAPWPPDGWWVTGGCPLHSPGLPDPSCPEFQGSKAQNEDFARWEGEGGA